MCEESGGRLVGRALVEDVGAVAAVRTVGGEIRMGNSSYALDGSRLVAGREAEGMRVRVDLPDPVRPRGTC